MKKKNHKKQTNLQFILLCHCKRFIYIFKPFVILWAPTLLFKNLNPPILRLSKSINWSLAKKLLQIKKRVFDEIYLNNSFCCIKGSSMTGLRILKECESKIITSFLLFFLLSLLINFFLLQKCLALIKKKCGKFVQSFPFKTKKKRNLFSNAGFCFSLLFVFGEAICEIYFSWEKTVWRWKKELKFGYFFIINIFCSYFTIVLKLRDRKLGFSFIFYVFFINSLSVFDTHKPQQPAIMPYGNFCCAFSFYFLFFLLSLKLWHAPRVSPEGISRADNSHNILHILVSCFDI